MISAAKIVEQLEKERELLLKLGDTEVSGFALLVPPEGEAIRALDIGSHVDTRAFYTGLAEAMKKAMEAAGMGGVRTPGGFR